MSGKTYVWLSLLCLLVIAGLTLAMSTGERDAHIVSSMVYEVSRVEDGRYGPSFSGSTMFLGKYVVAPMDSSDSLQLGDLVIVTVQRVDDVE